MSRNRIIYQSKSIVTSKKDGSSIANLYRLFDISTSTDVARKDVNVLGKLASIDRPVIEEPKVSLEFSYYPIDGQNESNLGLRINDTNLLSDLLAGDATAERNYFILVAPEGQDANGQTPDTGWRCSAVGNGFLSKYNLDLKVGEFPTVAVSIEGSNLEYSIPSTGGLVPNPSIDLTQSIPAQYTGSIQMPEVDVTGNAAVQILRPADITVDFGIDPLEFGGVILPGMGGNEAQVQSVAIEVPLSRKPQKRLGTAFAFSRPLDVPITVNMTVTVEATDLDTGSLVDLLCADQSLRDITVSLYAPCETGTPMMKYTLKGASIDSQSFKGSIGPNDTVDLKFSAQIGGANDTARGLFLAT